MTELDQTIIDEVKGVADFLVTRSEFTELSKRVGELSKQLEGIDQRINATENELGLHKIMPEEKSENR